VRGLTIKGCALLLARATAFAIAWTILDFMVNLKSPYYTSTSQPKRMATTTRIDLSYVASTHGCGV
jgi:hypothetical protein